MTFYEFSENAELATRAPLLPRADVDELLRQNGIDG
jgi:hypothetical protein